MDISGVDVDFLSDEEILELCSDTVDSKSEEISVLNGMDVNNLSDDKVQEIYDDVIYGSQNLDINNKSVHLTEQQILDINYNTVDMENNEIILSGGKTVNIDSLSDDEILAVYNDTLDSEDSFLIAAYSGTCSVYIIPYYGVQFTCKDANGYSYTSSFCTNYCYVAVRKSVTSVYFKCTGKGYAYIQPNSYGYYISGFASGSSYYSSAMGYMICK
ncbi:MAG: hypothetical protein LUH05_00580 [Candidatus Gastranaerophilales bacterium]|nr:hypothetical protein [Candidatus Gastranaerophilales bacterium]